MLISTATRDRLRRIAPWWAKIGLKLLFAKVPLAYSILRHCGLARHGGMERPQFAFDAFHRHFDNVEFANKSGDFTVLELGPGDSVFSALLARAYGAKSVTLVDVGFFANTDVGVYRRMADFLKEKGLDVPDLSDAQTFEDVLAACNARYESEALESLKRLPAESFDFIFSNGVIQSIWRHEVAPTLAELRRLLKPGGASIHSLDLRDTVGGSLQHLRFSEKTWESDWFRSAGFYTNRLRAPELTHMARQAGFEPRLDEVNSWPSLPIPRHKLDTHFQSMSDDDLRIATIRMVMLSTTPPGPPTSDANEAQTEMASST